MGGARQSRCGGRVMEDTAMFANTQVATARVIHTPSAFARESLLHLQEAGMLRALAPHVSRRENLPSYLCFLVTAGAGSRSFPARPTGSPGMRSCCASRTRPWRRSGRTAAFPMPTILPEASKKSRALPQRTTADSGKCRTRKTFRNPKTSRGWRTSVVHQVPGCF